MEAIKTTASEFYGQMWRLYVERYKTLESAVNIFGKFEPLIAGLDHIIKGMVTQGEVVFKDYTIEDSRLVLTLELKKLFVYYLTFNAEFVDHVNTVFRLKYEESPFLSVEKNSDDAFGFMFRHNRRKRERVVIASLDVDVEYGTYAYEDGDLLNAKYFFNVETSKPVVYYHAYYTIPLAFYIARYLLRFL